MIRSETNNRGVVYVRRSTNKNEQSLPDQLDWAVRTAKGRGIEMSVPADDKESLIKGIVTQSHDVYCDDAISGAVESRPGLHAMLRRIKQDKTVAFLFVWERSRLGRFEKSQKGMELEQEITELGVTIVFRGGEVLPKRISDGPQYEDIAATAEYITAGRMRVDLAENTLRGLSNSAKAGYWCGGNPPYGFVRAVFYPKSRTIGEVLKNNRSIRGDTGETVVLIPGPDAENQDRLKIVRFIAEEYARGLAGLHAIAKELNQRGLPSPYAGRKRRQQDGSVREVWGMWTVNSIRGILENPVYSAKMAYGRREYGSIRRFKKGSDTGYRKVENHERKEGSNKAIHKEHRDIEDWLLVDPAAPFDPIVPFALYQANLDRLKKRAIVGGQRGRAKCADPNKYPLAVFCGDCGQRMSGHNHGKHATWMCSKFINSHRELCHNNWIMRDEVVVFTVEQVRRKIHHLAHRERLEAEINSVLAEHRSCQSELEKKIKVAKAKIAILGEEAKHAYEGHLGARSESERKMTRDAYDKRHEVLSQEEVVLRRLESDLAMQGIGGEDQIAQAVGYLENFDRLLTHLPEDLLRRTFDALGVRLDVKFAPNIDPRSTRMRVPTGGTLTFGASGISKNDSTPAEAEVDASNETWLGCGGRI